MELRFRILAALLALTGLLGFAPGEAWATVSATQTEASVISSHDAADAGLACVADLNLVPDDGSEPIDGTDPSAPQCPMPSGATGACGAGTAVLASSSLELGASLHEARLSLHRYNVREILFAAPFFRPPIA